jgi:hypothetical protein
MVMGVIVSGWKAAMVAVPAHEEAVAGGRAPRSALGPFQKFAKIQTLLTSQLLGLPTPLPRI